MKKILFTVFLISNLGPKFDLPGFLAASEAIGIRLQGNLVDPINGHVQYDTARGTLEITLYDEDLPSNPWGAIQSLPSKDTKLSTLSTATAEFKDKAAPPPAWRK